MSRAVVAVRPRGEERAMRRQMLGAAVLMVLWFAFAAIAFALQSAGGSLATLGLFVPSPMARGEFFAPMPWSLLLYMLTAAVLFAGYVVLTSWFSLGGRTTLAAGWLAAVLIAFAVGAVIDLGNLFAWWGQFGVRGALGTMGSAPLTAWWGLVGGWIPALIARGPRAASADGAAASSSAARRSLRSLLPLTIVAAVALLALPFVVQAGSAAVQTELRQRDADAQQQADPGGAAIADPSVSGEPVPTAAPNQARSIDHACTAENTTILAPTADAATGHRMQPLHLINTSEEPCVVDGYPDVVFGDQNRHLLDVAIDHGSSFMASDPGAAPLTLPPGEAADAAIGWDANSVTGQLAARQLWVGVFEGADRLSWDVTLDIVADAAVSVTAWHAPSPTP